jgi:DNA mismatch repair protein MutL
MAGPAGALEPGHAERQRQELVQWAKGQLGDRPAPPASFALQGDAGLRQARLDFNFTPDGGRVPEFRPFPEMGGLRLHGAPPVSAESMPPPAHPHPAATPQARETLADGSGAQSGIQVHNRYLITENESGVVIIDQHALHERILYEQLREKVLSGVLERQRLLVPEPVQLTPAEAAAALGARQTPEQLGIEIEPFGGDTVLVSTYPALLANFNPSEVLRQFVAQLLGSDRAPEPRDLLDEMLHMISCKAAIKAGDRLSPAEVTALLEQRHLYQDTHHCPHGRPTALVFTREELDKRFKRT